MQGVPIMTDNSSRFDWCTNHPLMLVRPLDAPTPGRQRRRIGRGHVRGGPRGRGNRYGRGGGNRGNVVRSGHSSSTHYHESRGTVSVHTQRTWELTRTVQCDDVQTDVDPPSQSSSVDQAQSVDSIDALAKELSLSETDSEEESALESRTQKIRITRPSNLETDFFNEFLLADLYLSSNTSSTSSSSDITGPSCSIDSEDDYLIPERPTRILYSFNLTEGYIPIRKMLGPTVLEDFSKMNLKDPPTLIETFRSLCFRHPLDLAAHRLLDKLKPLQMKELIKMLKTFHPLFKERFFTTEMSSELIYGCIILNIIYYWYDKGVSNISLELLSLFALYHIDPLRLRRFHKPGQRHINMTRIVKLTEPTEVASICCEVYYVLENLRGCVKLLARCLTMLMEKNMKEDINFLRPFVKRVFQHALDKKKTGPLLILFLSILEVQENLEYPIDLAQYYDGALAIHLATTDSCRLMQALNLYYEVNQYCYIEASGTAYRGLLAVAVQNRESLFDITEIFHFCVNTRAFPMHDPSKWTIQLYSSMTKMEMQLYFLQCIISYTKRIWSGCLSMVKTFLTIQILLVPNTTRDYIYSAHPAIAKVDHSLQAAYCRAKSVIYHYLRLPLAGYVYEYSPTKLVIFAKTVEKLFSIVLQLDNSALGNPTPWNGINESWRKNPSLCPICKTVKIRRFVDE